jgi:hypothetical protein
MIKSVFLKNSLTDSMESWLMAPNQILVEFDITAYDLAPYFSK